MTMYNPISITTTPITLKGQWQGDAPIVSNRALGGIWTLPAATGSGFKFYINVGTAISGGTLVIQVANSSDTMTGLAIVASAADNTSSAWETVAASDTITLNGTTTGGLKGDRIELVDMASTIWGVRVFGAGSGTLATPFSAAV